MAVFLLIFIIFKYKKMLFFLKDIALYDQIIISIYDNLYTQSKQKNCFQQPSFSH